MTALFFQVALTVFIAEMGDKTQLLLVGLTSKYKIRDIVAGTAFAILVLNGIAVLAGGLVSVLIPDWLIKFVAAAAFFYFSVTSLGADEEDEEEAGNSILKFAPLAVFCSFFVAELGDKTQLSAITFGANGGISNAVVIWLACSAGLFAADIIGMLAGLFLKKNIPELFMHFLAFVLFGVFGFVTLHEGLCMLGETLSAGENSSVVGVPVLWIMLGAAVVFAGLSVLVWVKGCRKND